LRKTETKRKWRSRSTYM